MEVTFSYRLSVKSAVAARLGATPKVVADTSAVRAWIELDKVF